MLKHYLHHLDQAKDPQQTQELMEKINKLLFNEKFNDPMKIAHGTALIGDKTAEVASTITEAEYQKFLVDGLLKSFYAAPSEQTIKDLNPQVIS